MERVIVTLVDRSAHGRAVDQWASQEATMGGLALRVIHRALPDVLGEAQLVVTGLHALDAVAVSACPVVSVPEGHRIRHPEPRSPRRRDRARRGRPQPCRHGARLRLRHRPAAGHTTPCHARMEFPSCAAELPFGVPEEDRAAWEDHEVQLLADALRPWREKYPEVRLLEDVQLSTPAQALVQRSVSAGLVVVGRGSQGESGPVALLREAMCPVAVVPS